MLTVMAISLALHYGVVEEIETRRAGNRVARAITQADTMIVHAQRTPRGPQICITQDVTEIHRALGKELRIVSGSFIASSGYETSCTFLRNGRVVAVLWMINPAFANFGESVLTNRNGFAYTRFQGLMSTNATATLLKILSGTGLTKEQCFRFWQDKWPYQWGAANESTAVHQ